MRNLNHPRVFVVDDETLIGTTLGLILRTYGFDAHSFDKPQEALRSARALAPDLLLTDVVMPELSGVELAVQMSEDCPDCKVLLFSGHPDASEALLLTHGGGRDFEMLAKPVHPADLVERIRTMMDA